MINSIVREQEIQHDILGNDDAEGEALRIKSGQVSPRRVVVSNGIAHEAFDASRQPAAPALDEHHMHNALSVHGLQAEMSLHVAAFVVLLLALSIVAVMIDD